MIGTEMYQGFIGPGFKDRDQDIRVWDLLGFYTLLAQVDELDLFPEILALEDPEVQEQTRLSLADPQVQASLLATVAEISADLGKEDLSEIQTNVKEEALRFRSLKSGSTPLACE